jgi:hypothetical protein
MVAGRVARTSGLRQGTQFLQRSREETMVKFSNRLSLRQRDLLADKFADAANLAGGALIFGQAITDRAVSLVIAVVGLGLWMLLIMLACVLSGVRPAGRRSRDGGAS